ncbi:MAG: tetratricopeptide repeat protein [Thalassotalea sp.]
MKLLYQRLSVICLSLVLTLVISSCSVFNQSDNGSGDNSRNNGNAKTLAGLLQNTDVLGQTDPAKIKETLKIQLLTRQQRSEKLTQIYRSILTLEPNKQVRAQIQHRMVQLDIEKYEKADVFENKEVLTELAAKYQNLLSIYPNRVENEEIQYQLAKTYDLLGDAKASILTLEALLKNYPDTQYYVESQFRRAELYYNLQQYPLALTAYQAVLAANNNENYRLNSLYMSGWSLFKLNRLSAADDKFIAVLQHIVGASLIEDEDTDSAFTFVQVSSSAKSLAMDTQRVLSISLSQQQQVKSLIELLNRTELESENIKFDHLLFDNLAKFLLEKKLKHDAILTYQAYLDYAPNTMAAARFSLALMALHQQNNQFVALKQLKARFVNTYGLNSTFWQQATHQQKNEVLPYLTDFSLGHSRRLYANAQILESDVARQHAFVETAAWLKTYLDLVAYNNQQIEVVNLAPQEHFLFAEASFEAQHYQPALASYQMLAYDPAYSLAAKTDSSNSSAGEQLPLSYINNESAYAAIITLNAMMAEFDNELTQLDNNRAINATEKMKLVAQAENKYQHLLEQRQTLDDLFIAHYGDDRRAKLIAVKAAEYAFSKEKLDDVIRYADFVLSSYQINSANIRDHRIATIAKLDNIALKQIKIVSQLKANIRYQAKQYDLAEQDYLLALAFVSDKVKTQQLNELIASSIFEQAKAQKPLNIELAIGHYLRLGQQVPNSKYRANAEFDAANLLIANKLWSRSITVLGKFQQQFKHHQYSAAIPAKLALCYEQLEDWSQAAKQLLVMVTTEQDINLKREAQYTAAQYYLKAGDTDNARINFRAYAHQYPEPFAVAQEVRFKLSEFYLQSKEPNKRYFWYRKIIKHHQQQVKKTAVIALERSTYLASYAAFHLGQAHQQTFNWTKLKAPLNNSLKRKQAAMKEAIHYYQLVFGWQLAEFVPQANYAIGQIYRNLAADVMKSERPSGLDELALEEYEFILEEIAYPFEEKAIEVHQANAERAWQNVYDQWVKKSLAVLAEIEPAKYHKFETVPEVINDIF